MHKQICYKIYSHANVSLCMRHKNVYFQDSFNEQQRSALKDHWVICNGYIVPRAAIKKNHSISITCTEKFNEYTKKHQKILTHF